MSTQFKFFNTNQSFQNLKLENKFKETDKLFSKLYTNTPKQKVQTVFDQQKSLELQMITNKIYTELRKAYGRLSSNQLQKKLNMVQVNHLNTMVKNITKKGWFAPLNLEKAKYYYGPHNGKNGGLWKILQIILENKKQKELEKKFPKLPKYKK